MVNRFIHKRNNSFVKPVKLDFIHIHKRNNPFVRPVKLLFMMKNEDSCKKCISKNQQIVNQTRLNTTKIDEEDNIDSIRNQY